MKVKCIFKKYEEVDTKAYGFQAASKGNSNFYININETYIVYGMTLKDGNIWYYLCDLMFTYFPRWKPSLFFEVVDPRISRYWIYSFNKLVDYIQAYPIITFPEWANNHPDFYDKLTDGEEREVEIFKNYKELMDLEFADSSILEAAQIGDDQWLICPKCKDAWQNSDNRDALVKCPKCSTIFNNPRYKDVWPGL